MPYRTMNHIQKACLKYMVPADQVGSALATIAETAVSRRMRLGLMLLELEEYKTLRVSLKNREGGLRVTLKVHDAVLGAMARSEIARDAGSDESQVACLHADLLLAVARGAASVLPYGTVFGEDDVRSMPKEEADRLFSGLVSHLDTLRLLIHRHAEEGAGHGSCADRYSVERFEILGARAS